MKVWENSKKLWKYSPAALVPTTFLVLPNFRSTCFCDSVKRRSACFVFLKHLTHLPLPSSHPNLYSLSAAYFTILKGLLGSREPFVALREALNAKSTFQPAFSAMRLIVSKSLPVICTGLRGRNGLRFSTLSVNITYSATVPPIRRYAGNRAFCNANIRFSVFIIILRQS